MRWFSIFKQKGIKRHNHPSQREERTAFTSDFFKFLLAFSLIILASFTLLASLGLRDSSENLSTPGVHISSPCSESQLSQEKC